MPPIYVINLPTSTDRWAQMEAELARHGLDGDTQRVAAVDGRKLARSDLLDAGVSLRTTLSLCGPIKTQRCHHWTIDNPGAIGCTLSHVKVWRAIAAGNAQYAVVLEDDARLTLQPGQDLPTPGTHDVLLLTGPPPGQRTYQGPVTPITSDFSGTTGYVVTRHGAYRLLHHAFPIEQHVDHYMASLAQLGLLRLATVTKAIVVPNGLPSTISHSTLLPHQLARWRAAAIGMALMWAVSLFVLLWRPKKNWSVMADDKATPRRQR